ncbi:MAG: protein kinase [Labilithrix sp.]|nr:protein kinase [Labilithrix sp.]
MSNCLDDNRALELLDGRLPSAARAAVERHIESCDACRELVAELAKVDGDESGGAADTERTPLAESSGLTHAGPYRIERQIGSGAAGTVYRAVDDRAKEVVALKYVTDPAWRARFGREVETLARLAHPGIVRYLGHGETPHGLYLAMEWLDGEDLERCLRRGPLPWQAIRLLGLRLTAALAHAHALGAVHRDLGPRNVFLPGGRVEDAKLLDFGLVRVSDGLERTASQAVLGTPFYMAPEQVKDPKNVDARADLFALGVLFYEAVSGTRPFQGEDLFTVWVKIVDHPAPDLRTLTRGVPEAFILLVEALLAKDPNGRPASAADVHQGLVLLEGLARSADALAQPHLSGPGPAFGSSSGPSGLGSRAASSPPPRRGSGVFVAAGVGVTALVAVSTLAVVAPRFARRSAPSESSESSESSGSSESSESSDPSDPSASSDPSEAPPSAPSVPAKVSLPDDTLDPVQEKNPAAPAASGLGARAESAAVETLFCGAENVEHRRGGHYRSHPTMLEQAAVTIGGLCQATLEDCVIDGPRSVKVLNAAELTLRRCRVLGDITLVGAVTLTLEGTTLSKAPTIVGKARVIRR